MERDQRRLAAVVSADVAGYSSLMGQNESVTLAALKAHRRELIDPKIAEYGGRIVKTTGDGLLLEFPSVVDAVRCVVDVQRGMAKRNVGVPPERRIEFRVGINIGDIIIDGDDIYGDGVNVAARLQGLAEPGGICASRVVRDQVLDKLSFTFEAMGVQQVKNIARPVEVYRIRDDSAAAAAGPSQRTLSRARGLSRLIPAAHWRWLAGAGAAIVIAGIATWYVSVQTKTLATTVGPPLMSVAVMPFTSGSGRGEDQRLAERLTQSVTSAAERAMRFALVASYGLVTKYKDQPIDPRAVGRDLNVRYLLEGDVRVGTGAVVFVARLVETTNGTQLWSDRLTGPAPTDNDGGSDIVAQLTNRLRLALYAAEMKRVAHLPTAGANSMELVLRADALMENDPSLNGMLSVRKLYEEALRQDPRSAPALSGLYVTVRTQLLEDPSGDHPRLVKELDDLSLRAVRADPEDPRAWLLRSDALQWQRQWDGAFEANAEALRIDPYRTGALVGRAELLIQTGRAEEAFAVIDRGIALDPRSVIVSGFLYRQCRAHLFLGHYDDAIAGCEKGIARDGEYWWFGHLLLTAAYAQKGDMTKAAATKAALLERQPWVSIARVKALPTSNHPVYLQQEEAHLYPGLRKAGIPEK